MATAEVTGAAASDEADNAVMEVTRLRAVVVVTVAVTAELNNKVIALATVAGERPDAALVVCDESGSSETTAVGVTGGVCALAMAAAATLSLSTSDLVTTRDAAADDGPSTEGDETSVVDSSPLALLPVPADRRIIVDSDLPAEAVAAAAGKGEVLVVSLPSTREIFPPGGWVSSDVDADDIRELAAASDGAADSTSEGGDDDREVVAESFNKGVSAALAMTRRMPIPGGAPLTVTATPFCSIFGAEDTRSMRTTFCLAWLSTSLKRLLAN